MCHAIDANYEENDWICYLNGGRIRTDKRLFTWAKEAQERGLEILFTSMTHDGVKTGYANDALAQLSDMLKFLLLRREERVVKTISKMHSYKGKQMPH